MELAEKIIKIRKERYRKASEEISDYKDDIKNLNFTNLSNEACELLIKRNSFLEYTNKEKTQIKTAAKEELERRCMAHAISYDKKMTGFAEGKLYPEGTPKYVEKVYEEAKEYIAKKELL